MIRSIISAARSLYRPTPAPVSRHMSFGDLQEVRAIGNLRGGLVTNKAGRGVFRARHRGRDVKLYEAHSASHAEFIAAMTAIMPDTFPRVLELREAWVMAEWVEGSPLDPDRQDLQAGLLKKIQATPIAELPLPDFCYWSDYLIPRFQRAAALAGRQDQAQRILDELETDPQPAGVMHPDLSPANLLQTDDGRLVSLDNELLSMGTRPLLDLCNALRPLTRPRREKMVRAWFEQDRPSASEMRTLGMAWTVRETGAAFITGNLAKCQSLMDAALRDPVACLPFPIDTADAVSA